MDVGTSELTFVPETYQRFVGVVRRNHGQSSQELGFLDGVGCCNSGKLRQFVVFFLEETVVFFCSKCSEEVCLVQIECFCDSKRREIRDFVTQKTWENPMTLNRFLKKDEPTSSS